MKVLFIGIGMTNYYNQVLNKLSTVPGLEIFNLIANNSVGHVGDGVYQTKEGITFNIISAKEITKNIFSDFKYKSFYGLDLILKENKPDIIVLSETYIKTFMREAKIVKTIEDLGIKIIMKDIPFRLNRYDKTNEDIASGEATKTYIPFFINYISFLLQKIFGKHALISKERLGNFILVNIYKTLFAKKVLRKKLEEKKEVLNFPDAHVDYIEDAYDIFGSYGVPKEKIFIIYNSPDTDYMFAIREQIEKNRDFLPHSDYRIIHVGRLIPWKNVDLLIRATANVKKVFPELELLIIGTGPEERKLKDLASELNIENNVKFIGGVYDPYILGKYLISSSFYVLAGMGGISINDAMIFGKPVICSVCDGTEKKLVYENRNGLYFKDKDCDSLTKTIIKMLNNQEIIKKMGAESTKIIKDEINIHTVVHGYTEAFNYVLNK